MGGGGVGGEGERYARKGAAGGVARDSCELRDPHDANAAAGEWRARDRR